MTAFRNPQPAQPPDPIRVLIADDDPIVRELLTRVFRRKPNFALVGEAADGAEAVRLAAMLKPDVLLLDLLMPHLPGMDTLRALTSTTDSVRIILFCAYIGKRQIVEALQLGARGILLKKSVRSLEPCIQAVVDGNYWVEDREVGSVAEIVGELVRTGAAELKPERTYNLTERELQIISLVTLGEGNRAIGNTLSISEDTVKRHLANIFNKVGMSTRVELAMFAVEHRLVPL
jgi:two-component system, NarL family, nitrate/nitrite response regulator NarL